MPTMVDVDQYKSALTPQQVDTALKKIADNDIADFLTRQDLLNVVYPVGSIYTSVNNVSPRTFLGGTWQQIQERFLLASGGNYTAGSTGGEAVHTLTKAELPNYTLPTAQLEGEFWNMAGQNASYPNGDCSGIVSRRSNSEGVGYATSYTTAQDGFAIDATHTHSSGGSGQAHNNMPPYLVVYMWKRTA